MPPKAARGRGSARARGSGRGGAAASRESVSVSEPTDAVAPQEAESATAVGSPAQAVTPKPELQDDPKQALPAAAPETAHSTSEELSSTIATPQDAADPSARPEVQRLGSLNSARSATPASRRGVASRGKRGTVKPPFSGRRSKEERETREKELLEREKERRKEQDAEDQKKKRQAESAAKRAAARSAGRGRGGYSSAMSGPFSLGSSREDRKQNPRGASSFYSGSGSRATRVKDEGGSGSGSGSRSTGGPSIKREDGGIISSDDEDDAEFPRKDIDTMEISSDENENAPSRPQRAILPVRIGRKEHQERTIGINTEASAEVGGKVIEQAGLGAQSSPSTSRKHTVSKGKGKAPDVEVTGTKKPFKGVWQDAEEVPSPVKTEQNSEDEEMPDAEAVRIVDRPPQAANIEEQALDMERKLKSRMKNNAEPILQTEQDREEHIRVQMNMKHMRAELGPDDTPTADSSGDTNMDDGSTKKPNVRDNNVYLFQIPPLMPELRASNIKHEPLNEHAEDDSAKPGSSNKTDPKVKVEEGFSDPSAKASETRPLASGYVGKLRVFNSGRTTLDWGGNSFEVKPGQKVSFLQEAVSVEVIPEKDRVVPEDAGNATSFGRVKGKFVVTPDWDVMLG